LGKGSCASLDRNGRSRDDAEGRDSEIRPSHEAPDRSASHQDLATTQRYMHLSPAAIENAIRLLDQPKPVHGLGDILETPDREPSKSLT